MSVPKPGRASSKLAMAVELLALLLSAGCLAFALRVDRQWVLRHVTQLHHWPEWNPERLILPVRGVAAAFGIAVVTWIRPALKRAARNFSAGGWAAPAARVLLAVICSLAMFEVFLRWKDRTHPSVPPTHEVLGIRHARYGWIWKPSYSAPERVGRRTSRWTFNRDGIRVRSPDEELDPSAPTILFTGESIAAGKGLEYDETYPALISAHLGVQSVNLAVNAYGADQAYLRLADAMPQFKRLIATVTVFLPVQIGRNLLDDKARLVLGSSGALELVPAASGLLANLRVRQFFWNEFPYSSESAIQRSVALTAAILRETAERTRARGATPLFLIPSYGPPRPLEAHDEAWLVRPLFEKQHLPFLVLDLPRELLIDGDHHPNPQGAALIATSIERSLAAALATQ